MSNVACLHATALVYVACNSTRLFAYLPQLRGLIGGHVAHVPVATWLSPVLASATTVAYGLQLHSNWILMAYAGANALAGLLVAGAGWWLRTRRQAVEPDDAVRAVGRPGGPCSWGASTGSTTSIASDDLFYAAERATTRPSGFDDAARLRGVHAPFFKTAFLDRVTRDERDAVLFQFRPFDLAPRVRVRTTRMEGTA